MLELKKITFKILNRIERFVAFVQGKGYGSATIKQEISLVFKLLREKPILAVDIGGNVGEYTAELINRFPALEVHTFEPSKVNIKKLMTRFVGLNINIVPFAASDVSGGAILFSNESGSGLGCLTKRNLEHFNINFDVTEKIETIRFEDYWVNTLNSRNIDIVKMDIEGYELNALIGFGEAVKKVKIIQFEFGGCNIDTKTYFKDFWNYFNKYNFLIYRITPIGADYIENYQESDEFFSTTNFIAVNSNLVK